MIKHLRSAAILLIFALNFVAVKGQFASFTGPDTVCLNTPVTFTNTSVGASSYYWNFCVGDLNKTPTAVNLGNPSSALSWPVFMDYVKVNNNYYGFVVNYDPGGLVRLDFGNSLLNTPTAVNLGNFGGIIPIDRSAEGIQVVQNEGKWYAIIVGGYDALGIEPRVLKIEFGTDITNPAPTAFSWGNLGNMDRPIDLHLFRENNNWYGFTVNSENNTITRFDFTNSFDNTPTGINLGNLGNLAYPTGIYVINDNGNHRVFISNGGNGTTTSGIFSLTRLDFGNSLLNTPTAVNLGNPGNVLQHPRDLTIMKSCNEIVGFAVNGHANSRDIVKFNFNNDLSSVPTGSSLGNIGNLGFPHSISKLFRVDDDLYGFVTNVNNNTITRFQISGCTNASMPSSNAQTPPAIIYNSPGTYNVNLTIDDGLPTQSSFCKQVVVLPNADFTFEQDVCDPATIHFEAAGNATTASWTFGDGNMNSGAPSPGHTYTSFGNYDVEISYPGACAAKKTIAVNLTLNDIILTADTTICYGSTKQLLTMPSSVFCWSPTSFLDNPLSANPTTSAENEITYFFTARITGNNLITNGDFSGGNTGFTSDYTFASANNAAGQYFVGPAVGTWNPAFSNCAGHSGNGNMMMLNGSTATNTKVWEQTVAVTPNTNYNLSAWIQSISSGNAAAVQFLINGQRIGQAVTASTPSCTWNQNQLMWNSGDSSTATIAIVNNNIQATGNDFAIDDIFFGPVFVQRDSVKISVEKTVVQTNNDTIVCGSDQLQLNATGASAYVWSPAAGLSNANISDPIVTAATATQYIVTGTTVNGCIAKDTVVISTIPQPVFVVSANQTVCEGSSVQLNASGGDSYSWLPATSLNNAALPNPVASPGNTTVYSVTISEAVCGFDTTINTTVVVSPPPIINLQKSNDINCNTPTAKLTATGASGYVWTPVTGLDNPNTATPEIAIDTTTTYHVTGSGEAGCSSTASITVKVDKGGVSRFVLPNAFTPNNDGKNDCFGIKRWGNAAVQQFSIYNRWGQLIFTSRSPSDCWDGTFNGKDQDGGGYAYVIRALTLCGQVTQKGIVMLVR